MPPVLGFRRRWNLAKPSDRWRTDCGQAMGHDTGWKVNIDVDTIIVRVEDKWLPRLVWELIVTRHFKLPP